MIILNYFLYFSRLLLMFGASRKRPALKDDLSVFFLGLGKTLAFEPVPAALIPVNPPLLDSAVTVDY